MSAPLIPMLLLAPLLIAVIIGDLARLTISNRLVLMGLGLFAVTVPVAAPAELPARMMVGAVVFLMLLILFMLGTMGGGDVKMLSVVVLFVPPTHWANFALAFSAALLVGVGCVSGIRFFTAPHGPTGWLALDEPKAFPMGVSIGLAGLAIPALAIGL